MKKEYLSLVIAILLYSTSVYSQNQASVWLVGERSGLKFFQSNCAPSLFTRPGFATYSLASIADKNGMHQFSVIVNNVYNRKHEIMHNGSNIFPVSTAQAAILIVPNPEFENIYYIFRAYKHPDQTEETSWGLCYAIVDMNKNGGLGSVIAKNHFLHYNTCSKITAVHHRNGKDVWVLSREYDTDSVRAFLITKDGITKTVISETGLSRVGYMDMYGQLKASPQGDKIAEAYMGVNGIDLFDFDNETGVLSNHRYIHHNDETMIRNSVEFSSDGTMLYSSDAEKNNIIQYDISSGIESEIINSRLVVGGESGSWVFGNIQLAPDGRIYVFRHANFTPDSTKNYIGVIECPNKKGEGCGYRMDGVKLVNDVNHWWGPCFIQSWFSKQALESNMTSTNSPICIGADLKLFASRQGCAEVSWRGPNNFQSNEHNPVIPNAQSIHSGKYFCSFYFCEETVIDTLDVIIGEVGELTISDNASNTGKICPGGELELTLKGNFKEIYWSNGDSTNITNVFEPGTYYVHVIDSNGCENSAVYTVNPFDFLSLFNKDSLGIFFGKKCNTKYDTLTTEFKFDNETKLGLQIDAIFLKSGMNNFEILNKPQLPLSSGIESLLFSVKLAFTADSSKILFDTLVVRYSLPCSGEYKIPLKGNHYNSGIELILPDTTVDIGKDICIPILAFFSCNDLIIDEMANIKAFVSIDPDVFYPKSVLSATRYSISDESGRSVVYFEFEDVHFGNDTICPGYICGTVLLSEKNFTTLEFDYAKIDTKNYVTDITNGILRTKGVCQKPLRIIKMFDLSSLAVIQKTNSVAEINIESGETGAHVLKLFSANGSEIYSEKWHNSGKSTYSKSFDNLSTGLYYIVFISPMGAQKEKFLIVR